MKVICLLTAAIVAAPAGVSAAGAPESQKISGQEAFAGAVAAVSPVWNVFKRSGTGAPGRGKSSPVKVCPADDPKAAFTALTFNTALGPGLDVPYALQRLEPAARAIAAASWDVLCLDEVWTDADRDAVQAELGLPASQTIMADTRGQNENPADRCEAGQLDAGIACMRAKCSGIPDEDVQNCAAHQCRNEGILLYLQARRCFNCVIASAGKTADQIQKTCESSGASRLFGGRNGVMLAARRPLKNVETLPLPSSFSNRVALFATVDVEGAPVEVACTHLSAALGELPPNDQPFPDWDHEMNAQLDLVADRLAARAHGGAQLMLGDLNTGPKSTGDMSPDAPAVWSEISALGFASPAAQADPPLCSRCQGNVISPTSERYLIDHVLVRGRGKLVPECAGQAFDAQVSITDASGHAVTTNLSDHYGIAVRFSAR